jgi:hypothetical protein
LNPVPCDGSQFLGWTGDADCMDGQIVLSSNTSCVANFGP